MTTCSSCDANRSKYAITYERNKSLMPRTVFCGFCTAELFSALHPLTNPEVRMLDCQMLPEWRLSA